MELAREQETLDLMLSVAHNLARDLNVAETLLNNVWGKASVGSGTLTFPSSIVIL